MKNLSLLFCTVILCSLSSCTLPREDFAAVTDSEIATKAAMRILKKGGNAADAFISAQLMLANVRPQSTGLGGGFLAIYYKAREDKFYAIDAREEAHQNIDLDFLSKELNYVTRASSSKSIAIPGTAQGLDLIFKNFASFDLKSLARPAIKVAREGFKVEKFLETIIKKDNEASIRSLGKARLKSTIYYGLKNGDLLTNAAYADLLESLIANGLNSFYSGDIAQEISKISEINVVDLQSYRAVFTEVFESDFKIADKNYKLYGLGSPSSGAATITQLLHFDELSQDHSLKTNFKKFSKAYEFRNAYLADANFIYDVRKSFDWVKDKTFNTQLWSADDLSSIKGLQKFYCDESVLHDHGTSHIVIKDKYGNYISATSTIERIFGSAIMVSKYGFLLNNELTDFSKKLTACNAPTKSMHRRDLAVNNTSFGEKANQTYGYKKPLSSMSPIIIKSDDGQTLALGGSGGFTIIASVYQVIKNIFAQELGLKQAVNKPRIYFAAPNTLLLEPEIYSELDLNKFDFKIREFNFPTSVNAIFVNSNSEIEAAADRRKHASALSSAMQ